MPNRPVVCQMHCAIAFPAAPCASYVLLFLLQPKQFKSTWLKQPPFPPPAFTLKAKLFLALVLGTNFSECVFVPTCVCIEGVDSHVCTCTSRVCGSCSRKQLACISSAVPRAGDVAPDDLQAWSSAGWSPRVFIGFIHSRRCDTHYSLMKLFILAFSQIISLTV